MGSRIIKQLASLLVALLAVHWSVVGHAEQIQAGAMTLPRSFQGARLGMSQYDLMRTVPETARVSLSAASRKHGTLVVPARDRYIEQVEYRMYQGRLRELAIRYKRDRVPRGYEGLLTRLKETYGRPVAENLEEYDPRPNVFSVKKTVWEDPGTVAVLTETRKFLEGEEVHDLVLKITDRALQEAYEQDQEGHRRQQELSVPIPLDQPVPPTNRTATSGTDESPDRATG